MKELRVLVFSASFGNGHVRAAEAVIEGIRIKVPSANIIHLDFGAFLNIRVNTIIKDFYSKLLRRAPKLWGRFYYKTGKVHPQSMSQRLLNQLGRSNFLNYIQKFEPDLIVCTYPTVSSILAQLRVKQILLVPLATVITDYTVHSHWVHPGVDCYIVACAKVKELLVFWGIQAQNIHVTGIPVSPRFEFKEDRLSLTEKLGLRSGLPTFLFMGGTFGVTESIKRIYQKLTDYPLPVQCLVVCGHNEKLYNSLDEVVAQAGNPLVRYKFVHNVEELMSVSDVIITKAGGLTVSEALTKHLPLIIFRPIPGQEEENAQYVREVGAGYVAESEEELDRLLIHLLEHPDMIERMRSKAALASAGHSTERAVEEMLHLVEASNRRQRIG
ncbi:UDP-N-acetylglucosamine:LPS N-acetylglucosamine transferase [Desulfosporosinus acidiphilus SJ4]|uniref:UDP-N-acetylglucosamine:LPS N-acetylglucosamine transferase n=1 Tax=Desulfosporosinus acidiphilus (strain DSM 22704 / JCM 16185 / SJ4) TaxID=646529 RepID=I4DCH1_DESAJ|nr:UDP-N-acetylglucosamine--LPS N-acetylglucosamine transferase [Desulfosporosinus acidiphilus]AFM43495.1 UDP-N-acetylglucosamine:LPS N-acetylglucosamine transferase [Desulfosporosinus acidiphilus SJ4]